MSARSPRMPPARLLPEPGVLNLISRFTPPITRECMWGKGANQPLEVSVYSIAPGKEDPVHRHPDHIELVICWRGQGTVTIEKRRVGYLNSTFSAAIRSSCPWMRGTSSPPEACRTNGHCQSGKSASIPIKASKNWPVEKLELVVIHAHGCVREVSEPKAGPLPQPKILDRNDRNDKDLYSLMRPIGQFCGYARDVRLQCVRARVWGREAEHNVRRACR